MHYNDNISDCLNLHPLADPMTFESTLCRYFIPSVNLKYIEHQNN